MDDQRDDELAPGCCCLCDLGNAVESSVRVSSWEMGAEQRKSTQRTMSVYGRVIAAMPACCKMVIVAPLS